MLSDPRKIATFMRDRDIRGGTMLLGVSGGADSVAMLRGCCEAREDLDLQLHVLHVNHGVRVTSAADAEWVGELCRRLDVQCTIERIQQDQPVTDISEEQLRDARYDVFRRVAAQVNARWVAVAHTADDQTETVLHHILRGTSWRGLAGIPAVRPLCNGVDLIRPLLTVTRAEIEGWLSGLGQSFRVDETNVSPAYTRNRLRHVVLPMLREEYGLQVDQSLRTLAASSAELHSFVEASAVALLEAALLEVSPGLARLDCSRFSSQPPLVVREAFVILWQRQDWPRQAMTSRHWRQLAELAVSDSDTRRDLPGGIRLQRRGGLLVLTLS